MRLGDDQHRLTLDRLRTTIDLVDRLVIVTVDGKHLPTVALEALLRVIGHRDRRVALDRDVVRVVDEDEIIELHRTRPAARFVADAFLHVAVTAENPRLVRDLRLLRRKRQADTHRDTLTERSGRHFHTGHEAALGMTRTTTAPLTERLELVLRELAHSGKVEKRVNERGSVSAREDETIATGPKRILRIDVEMLKPQDARQIGHSERSPGMTRVGLFDHIRAKATNGGRDELILVD